ncbi:hypothetical protein M3J09_007468 [Ascochyta lentis]
MVNTAFSQEKDAVLYTPGSCPHSTLECRNLHSTRYLCASDSARRCSGVSEVDRSQAHMKTFPHCSTQRQRCFVSSRLIGPRLSKHVTVRAVPWYKWAMA